MSSEIEQLRDELDALKRQHIEFANHVRKETSDILGGLCLRLGPEHRAALVVGSLCTEAATIVQQHKMQQERAGGNYDLTTLHVHADTPSNSETPFEDE